jgi:formylglycine-generating enzyme required for sulfatase activity
LYGPYSSSPQNDPIGPPSTFDKKRCVRGGSWYIVYPVFFRCANRGSYFPDSRDDYGGGGFRLSAGPG